MENAFFKRLKLQIFLKIIFERCETEANVWRHIPPKVLQNSFKLIYRNQAIRETSTIPAIDIFKRENPSIEGWWFQNDKVRDGKASEFCNI